MSIAARTLRWRRTSCSGEGAENTAALRRGQPDCFSPRVPHHERRVDIEGAARQLGKPRGRYVTLDLAPLCKKCG